MNTNEYIDKLISYAIEKNLIDKDDAIYCTNRLLALLQCDEYSPTEETFSQDDSLAEVLDNLIRYASSKGLVDYESVVSRDIFDTEVMGTFIDRPSNVTKRFYELYEQSPKLATDYFYQLSNDSNYIRKNRIDKNIKWITPSEYGNIEMTINMSKPEKDPKAIALAGKQKSVAYPKCQLCIENVGYKGRVNHPARSNHRIIPLEICNQLWGFQYSPYVYYNEHCILLNQQHTPMKIDRTTFEKLLDFIGKFPHYIIGSNADLPIVGGSILSHEHFQGGNHKFAMMSAPSERYYSIKGFEDVKVSRVKWAMSVIRLESSNQERIVQLADRILNSWRNYSDEEVFIFAETDGTPHNTITPIASFKDGNYVLDLVLRNNITTELYPLGVYHPHEELHHIKKENIGLIEVMGLAVLPSRLDAELRLLSEVLAKGEDVSKYESLEKHTEWSKEILTKHDELDSSNAYDIVLKETGLVFIKVLEHAGVFKRDNLGFSAFDRFIKSI
ncbi:MAG: UDP-glucose--hexose-1-phosphate uridylyltransferase [Ruminococcus sp.]|nr:UDP-glucose--hexose-1-phosphate uridylyltransferase [Ruminococcus sp.]